MHPRPFPPLRAVGALALILVLAGCTEVLPGLRGRIEGTVTYGGAPLVADVVATTPLRAERAPAPRAPFVPGELIVGFRDDVAALARSEAPTAVLAALAPFGSAEVARHVDVLGAVLIRFGALDAERTLAAAATLAALPDVAYVHPNYLLTAARVPNDPLYARQWHYEAIDLPGAWDVTIGSTNTTVAVVDSGIAFAPGDPAQQHPDLVGKLRPGYDFITDPDVAGDGDGRDANPFDLSDEQHGSHVAGTIAAATDDAFGVAGVDWRARILPARALGVNGSGTLLDITEATLWAAGFAVAGVPANANPAHVINLSLGGALACPALFQDAFDLIEANAPRDAVVVVAAGNDDVDASTFAPANCRNVIVVGATEARDFRAPYSNYGARIDVMAPGGDLGAGIDRNSDGFPDGVLSLMAAPTHGYMQGTSMAAPHVAGVISLMKALDPALTRAEALALLTATADPLGAFACDRPQGTDCGAGLIDAAAALALLQGGEIPEPEVGDLRFDPVALDFGPYATELTVTLRNVGGAALTWQAPTFAPAPGNPGPMPDFTIGLSALSGTIPAGATRTLVVSVDRDRVGALGLYRFSVTFQVGAEQVPLPGSFVKPQAAATPSGPMVVGALAYDVFGEPYIAGEVESAGVISSFSFTSDPGVVYVFAWSDENQDLLLDDGDFFGAYPGIVVVVPGVTTRGVTVPIEPVIDLGADTVRSDVARALEARY